MKSRSALLLALVLAGTGIARAQDAGIGKPEPEPLVVDSAEVARTSDSVARALAAIPLTRVMGGARILPFIDGSGQPVTIGTPLLAFQILPFVDSRGYQIPIVKDGPAILPFVDLSGDLISIGKVQRIEPISQ